MVLAAAGAIRERGEMTEGFYGSQAGVCLLAKEDCEVSAGRKLDWRIWGK